MCYQKHITQKQHMHRQSYQFFPMCGVPLVITSSYLINKSNPSEYFKLEELPQLQFWTIFVLSLTSGLVHLKKTAFQGLYLVPSVLVTEDLATVSSVVMKVEELYAVDIPNVSSLSGETKTNYLVYWINLLIKEMEQDCTHVDLDDLHFKSCTPTLSLLIKKSWHIRFEMVKGHLTGRHGYHLSGVAKGGGGGQCTNAPLFLKKNKDKKKNVKLLFIQKIVHINNCLPY